MGLYRFYRYENDKKIYQSVFVDVKKRATGEYRIPVVTDAHCERDIAVFPFDFDQAVFVSYWFDLEYEEVEEIEDEE